MGDKLIEWVKGRASFGAACVLGIMTTLTDFVSQILSFAVDGILQMLMLFIVYKLLKDKSNEGAGKDSR